jgi:YD repeat-containing protein
VFIDLSASQRMEYDANGNLTYLGMASPGSATNAPRWTIRQFTYDASSNLTSVLYAGGNVDAKFAWDDRATLSYS